MSGSTTVQTLRQDGLQWEDLRKSAASKILKPAQIWPRGVDVCSVEYYTSPGLNWAVQGSCGVVFLIKIWCNKILYIWYNIRALYWSSLVTFPATEQYVLFVHFQAMCMHLHVPVEPLWVIHVRLWTVRKLYSFKCFSQARHKHSARHKS